MNWKSAGEISAILSKYPHISKLRIAFSLRQYALNAVYPEGYSADAAWADIIISTEAGRDLLELDDSLFTDIPAGDVYLALFGHFFHHDLLVDVERTDLEAVRSILDSELRSHKIRWPYRFGRLLYDKFNDITQSDRTDHIEPAEVKKLLTDTPQGVYQVDTLLSGPLGFLTSFESRYLPVELSLPLWHCSDTGCEALHTVNLILPRVAVINAYERLESAANIKLGLPSEWFHELIRLHRGSNWQQGREYYDLPALVADAIVGEERTILLTSALNSSAGDLVRDILGSPPRRRRLAVGPAERVASSLSDVEQLQLLLVLSDTDLIHLLDRCVFDRKIVIPPNQLRRAALRPRSLSWLDSGSEMSGFGIRNRKPDPIAGLSATIWEAYKANGQLDDLSWKIRKRIEEPSQTMLMDYIRGSGPAQAIRDLILSNRPTALHVLRKMNLQMIESEDVEFSVNWLLWKLGFNPSRYDDDCSRLRTHVNQFNDVLLRIGVVRSEADRDTIRSAGVNLFVLVERFLEQLIAYNTWLLSVDHFLEPRFEYNANAALASVNEALEAPINAEGLEMKWNARGGNTLGVLLAYSAQLTNWMKSLSSRDRSIVERDKSDLPHFADHPELGFSFSPHRAMGRLHFTGIDSVCGRV